MNPTSVVLRFDTFAEQSAGSILRIVGFIRARELLQLFDAADLEANPRSAKWGSVTDDIVASIEETPEIFVFKTKGVLVGASSYERLERKRFRLSFSNTKIEGILDGGHNMLAIGTHILSRSINDTKTINRIKRWDDFKKVWATHRDRVDALRAIKYADNPSKYDELDFLIPLEILVPSDPEDEDIVEEFNSSLLSICSARNNNVELTLETKANKKGYFEELRKHLPAKISKRVEWKTNDGGDIRTRDLIALAWIPLSTLDYPFIPEIVPQNLYRNKGECAKLFDQLMSNDDVSKATDGEYTRELHNEVVKSALVLAGDMPILYDKIYKDFPNAYNVDNGRFGKLDIVKMAKDMSSHPTTYYLRDPVDYSYPDGLIMPLVYGLKALMTLDDSGNVVWSEDPHKFLDRHLAGIVKKYKVILNAFGFDPQKVGKDPGSYELVFDAFETELMRARYSRKR